MFLWASNDSLNCFAYKTMAQTFAQPFVCKQTSRDVTRGCTATNPIVKIVSVWITLKAVSQLISKVDIKFVNLLISALHICYVSVSVSV